MPALKSITQFTLPKQPYMRDGQVTKDFLESVHEIDLDRMANLKLVDKRGKELVKLKLQVLA